MTRAVVYTVSLEGSVVRRGKPLIYERTGIGGGIIPQRNTQGEWTR